MTDFQPGDRVAINEHANANAWYSRQGLKLGDLATIIARNNKPNGPITIQYDKFPGQTFNNTPEFHTLVERPYSTTVKHRAKLAEQRHHLILD